MVPPPVTRDHRLSEAESRVADGQGDANGYSSAAFAEVYREFGQPRRLPSCGGSVLIRPIGETGRIDAMGCYPLFSCLRWDRLAEDLAELGRDCVSLVLVADPFSPLGLTDLQKHFDLVAPFKQHFVADLSVATQDLVKAKRYKSARAALQKLKVEVIEEPDTYCIDDWMTLQDELDRRHKLLGMKRLSREATKRLFRTPGLVIFRAILDTFIVGMHIDFVDGNRVYSHSHAYSAAGYRANASTALNVFEMDYFRGRVDSIDWGGVAGNSENLQNGLGTFKARFSNARLPVYLCGKIFDRHAYDAMARLTGSIDASYFPAYRAGEAI